MAMFVLSTLTLLAILSVLPLLLRFIRRHRYRRPPGPNGLPIIGNFFNAPRSFEWLVFQDWSRQYDSDIVYFEILGTRYFVLNSAKAATDLLEKRSNIYSDKPGEAPMVHLSGHNRNMGLMGYGNSWRAHRRLFHQYFRSTIVFTYHPSSTKAVREMIRRLRDTPDHFMRHIRFMAGSNILRIVYGMEVESEDDPNLALVEEGIKIVSRIANAGAYLVDSFPIMQHIPAWFPGAQFKRDGARWKPIVEEMFTRPYKELKASFDNGDPKPCVLTSMLYNISQDEEDPNRSMLEDVVINTSGTTYIAASDTTTSTLHTFVLAMSMHPELQKRAQEELGDIVGQDRLPEMGDRDALPFITAIVKECLRWRPALPLASPHRSVTDDEYEGFYIPAGSLVIGNAWAILHDKERYPDPDTFNPSRFINREGRLRKDVPDPTEAFGWGRRICPGRYFFLDLAWLAAANILAVFSIEKPIDELGNVVEPSGEYTTGLFSFPVPFKATFKVRSNVGVLV